MDHCWPTGWHRPGASAVAVQAADDGVADLDDTSETSEMPELHTPDSSLVDEGADDIAQLQDLDFFEQRSGLEGEIAFGHELQPQIRAAAEAARIVPPRFASLRRLEPAPPEVVARTPRSTQPTFTRSPAELRSAGQPYGRPAAADLPEARGRPEGRISMEQLFLPGVYERILAWQCEAEEAMVALREGRFRAGPRTMVIKQGELQPWAQGIIWDCRVPTNCVPCELSTR